MQLVSYGVTSAAGAGVLPLWQALRAGQSFRDDSGVCRWPAAAATTSMARLLPRLGDAAREALADHSVRQDGRRWGVVLASTKGIAEDLVWSKAREFDRDPLAPLLDAFLSTYAIAPTRRLCVSNACASSHAALFVAERWLANAAVDDVLLLAVDEVREFVASGFRALGALSPTGARPMAENRDGLQLGEAAVALWLSREKAGPLRIGPVGLETEGLSITRPSPDGGSLVRAAGVALANDGQVDFVVAHGTATPANDLVEANAIARALIAVNASVQTPVVGTKGCVGHTLGASGAIDLIAAAECLQREELFHIGQTAKADPALPIAAYCAGAGEVSGKNFRRALITSLGFGGVHAAVTLQREDRR